MASFDDSAALGAYRDWNAAVNAFWTIFSAATLGIVGLAVTMPRPLPAPWIRIGLATAFVVFACGNHVALLRAQRMFATIATALRTRGDSPTSDVPEGYRDIFRSAVASGVRGVKWFHIALSIAAVVAILCLPQRT